MMPLVAETLAPVSVMEFDGASSAPTVTIEDVPAIAVCIPPPMVPSEVVAADPTSAKFGVINPADVAAEREPIVSWLAGAIVPIDVDAEYPERMMPDACDDDRVPITPAAEIPRSCAELASVVKPRALAADSPATPTDRTPMIGPADVVVVAESPVSRK
jgi:hypothetical protein